MSLILNLKSYLKLTLPCVLCKSSEKIIFSRLPLPYKQNRSRIANIILVMGRRQRAMRPFLIINRHTANGSRDGIL